MKLVADYVEFVCYCKQCGNQRTDLRCTNVGGINLQLFKEKRGQRRSCSAPLGKRLTKRILDEYGVIRLVNQGLHLIGRQRASDTVNAK